MSNLQTLRVGIAASLLLLLSPGLLAGQMDSIGYDWSFTHDFHQRLREASSLELPQPTGQVQHFDSRCRETSRTRYCFLHLQHFPNGNFKQCVAEALQLIAREVRGELTEGARFLRRYHGQVDCRGNLSPATSEASWPVVEFNVEPSGQTFLLIWVQGEGIRITQTTFQWP